MICPNCSVNLLGRQRYRNTCLKCRAPFALEPKENPLRLHDVRVRKLAGMLADPLQAGAAPLRYTADQLRLAASRRVLAERRRGSDWTGCAGCVSVVGAVIAGFAVLVDSAGIFVAAVGLVVVVGMVCLVGHVATAGDRRFPGEPMSAAVFRPLLERWELVYGGPPPGMIRPDPVTDVWPPTPPVALLYCADLGTVQFLAASGIAQRRSAALITGPPTALALAVAAHPVLPVLVLHHADPAGCLTVPRLRGVLPPHTRLIDAGLRPRLAERAGPPVRVRPHHEMLDELARVEAVDAHELSWLARGNTYPLAAVRPARLLTAVDRALTQVDPEESRAAAVGFMAWPERVG